MILQTFKIIIQIKNKMICIIYIHAKNATTTIKVSDYALNLLSYGQFYKWFFFFENLITRDFRQRLWHLVIDTFWCFFFYNTIHVNRYINLIYLHQSMIYLKSYSTFNLFSGQFKFIVIPYMTQFNIKLVD